MAKVYSITAFLSMLFSGGLVFVMNLEMLSHIGGLVGIISALFFAYLAHRKKLLNAGFTNFRDQYRTEMDDFKEDVRSNVNVFRELMNENDARHTRTLDRIVELYEGTHKSVREQATTCKLIRTESSGSKKLEDLWKKNMKSELDQVQKDVAHMKKVINHVK